MSAIENRRNLDFLLYDVLKIASLFSSKVFEHWYRGTVAVIFDSAQTRAEEKFHPCAAAIDAKEPRFEHGKVIMPTEAGEAILAYAAAGFFRRSSGIVGRYATAVRGNFGPESHVHGSQCRTG